MYSYSRCMDWIFERFILIGLLVLSLSPRVEAGSEPVLLIESYHSEFGWDIGYKNGIANVLEGQIELFSFEMDTKRLDPSEFESRAQRALAYYRQLKPKYVVLADDNALRYMLPLLYDEPISIVFLGVNSNPRQLLDRYIGRARITGVRELPLFVRNMGEIGHLLGKSNITIRILFDASHTSQIAVNYILRQYQMIERNLGIHVEAYSVANYQQWQKWVRNAKNDGVDALIIGLYQSVYTYHGEYVEADQVMRWTHEHSKVPMFGFWDFSVGRGKTAGGVVLYGETHGEQAGKILRRIIVDGENARHIPIQVGHDGKAVYQPEEFEYWRLKAPNHWQALP